MGGFFLRNDSFVSDAWAPDFAYIFNLSSARDTPFAAPEPKRSELHFLDERALPPNDLQLALVDNHNKVWFCFWKILFPSFCSCKDCVFVAPCSRSYACDSARARFSLHEKFV
jgi:hypothetical protein